MHRQSFAAAIFFVSAGVTGAAQAQEERSLVERAFGGTGLWSLSAGVDYSSGDYGGPIDQEITSAPVTLSYSMGGWSGWVSSGWIKSELSGEAEAGETITIPGFRGNPPRTIVVQTPVSFNASADGLSDTTLGARYDFLPLANGTAFALTGSVKLPTADSGEGLGTGETDYAIGGEVGGLGAIAPYLGVGYEFFGDPEGAPLEDSAFLYAGLDFTLNGAVDFGLTYDFAQSSADGFDDPQSIGASLRWRLTERARVSAFGQAGLSDGAPDSNVGVRLILRGG